MDALQENSAVHQRQGTLTRQNGKVYEHFILLHGNFGRNLLIIQSPSEIPDQYDARASVQHKDTLLQ
jgi:hypothetical protein